MLLDTTVLIDLARAPGRPNPQRAHHRISRLTAAGETPYTSRINEAEFRVGPERSPDRTRELQRVEYVLLGVEILEFDARAATRYAVAKATVLRIGRPVGECDLLIAAVALANGQPLLTRNPRHFQDIPGLVVESY